LIDLWDGVHSATTSGSEQSTDAIGRPGQKLPRQRRRIIAFAADVRAAVRRQQFGADRSVSAREGGDRGMAIGMQRG